MNFKRRILVTGCAGAIGKYLVKKLLDTSEDYYIYGVDTKKEIDILINSKFLYQSNQFTPLSIDLMNDLEVKNLPEVDFVYHLAAINGTALFYSTPWSVYVNSIIPTINLINYYKDKNLTRFIYTSSSEVYASLSDLGINKIPTTENAVVGFSDITNPRWSYGGAKLSGEVALIAASNQLNLDFSIIRYHNVYGKNMGINHVIPDFINRGKNNIFELNGADNIRSFIYIDDAIDATILVANSEKAKNKIVNIGSSEVISMRDLGAKIMNLFGWKCKITEYPAPVGSTLRRCPDINFLINDLKFELKFDLNLGLSQLID
jgi:nucleoside-diphosphate-sugar epimerase